MPTLLRSCCCQTALVAGSAGAHILSGNVLQPTALDELLPEWRKDEECPIHRQPATASRFYYLTRNRAVRLPNPPQMKHKGNYVISLRWVAQLLSSCEWGRWQRKCSAGRHPFLLHSAHSPFPPTRCCRPS